ncbi:unnamed protein product [Caenorhabditis angaria]|uniref:DUF19 domain-containing protein n=1 Tax=Caenorhabditis angaria TaxID=860376 RepID=A0A9P1IG15_9PELO|nr:unnamed protein product [Caenorhabditis angaria]
MLRSILAVISVFVALCASSSYSPFLPSFMDYSLNNEQAQRYFFAGKSEAALGVCNSIPFQSAQAGFASAVGLDSTVSWRQASLLTNATITMIDSGIDGLAQVCSVRQQFAATLGFSYDTCINRFYLISLGNTDWWNVMVYTHLMKHLEFICSTGFDVYQQNVDCIRKGETTDGNLYKACFYKFNATVNANPNNFCGATETFIGCIKDFFTTECNSYTGWMQCELERVGFAYDCYNLSCNNDF